MIFNDHQYLWIIGLIVLLLGLAFLGRWYLANHSGFSRKRRKNYGKVISRAKRPMVMLSVKTNKR